MRKTYKRIISLLISFILLVSCLNITGFAESANNNPLISYIQSVLPGHLIATDVLPEQQNVKISNIFNVENSSISRSICFVLVNNSIYGKLFIDTDNNGAYSSQFDQEGINSINQAYQLGQKVSFEIRSNFLIMHTETSNIILETDPIAVNSIDITDMYNTQKFLIEFPYVCNLVVPSTRDVSYNLNVTPVANTSINGKGLCWAACVASMVNYRRGTSLSATNVYYTCWDSVNRDPNDIPVGNNSWIARAYSLNSCLITTEPGGCTAARMRTFFSQNKPLHISISNSDYTKNHSIVLCGIYTSLTTNYYTLMDPNKTSRVSVTVSEQVLTNPTYFRYTPSTGTTYSIWRTTRYYS